MNEKLLFFDVDGTLYRHDIRVPKSTVDAIHQCVKNGHYVMLCTGRNRCILPEEIRNLPTHGMIGGCGTFVLVGNQILTDAGVTGDDCMKVQKILYDHKIPFFVENSDFCYYDEEYVPPVFTQAINTMNKNYADYLKSMKEMPRRMSKITGYPEDRSKLEEVKNLLSPWFHVIIHDEYSYIEITLKNHSKGTGILTMIDHLGIPLENTYGFGDSNNDLEMLEIVAHPMVMGDATPKLKEIYPSTDSIYEDGIYNGLKRLGLI